MKGLLNMILFFLITNIKTQITNKLQKINKLNSKLLFRLLSFRNCDLFGNYYLYFVH